MFRYFFLLGILISVSMPSNAQNEAPRKVQFGFYFGGLHQFSNKELLAGIEMGSSSELSINQNWIAGFAPGLSLIHFKEPGNMGILDKSFIQLPFFASYFFGSKRFKPAISFGPDVKIALEKNGMVIPGADLSIHFRRVFNKFIFDPQIKYYYSTQFSSIGITLNFMGRE